MMFELKASSATYVTRFVNCQLIVSIRL